MAKNNPKSSSLQRPAGVESVIRDLERNQLIKSHVIRDCRHTGKGNPRNPMVQYKGINGTNQTLLEVHCGSDGCHKVYVVPIDYQKLQEYISTHYS